MLEQFGSSSLGALEAMSLSPVGSPFGSASSNVAFADGDDFDDEAIDEDLDDDDDDDLDDLDDIDDLDDADADEDLDASAGLGE